MIRRQFYGWWKDDRFFLSRLPPDAPVRPSTCYGGIAEIKALMARKGVSIYWSPPLPDHIHAEIEKSLRLDRG